MDVWYVSYGSNLCEDRFMCYINGDRPPGSDKREIGCTDKAPPKVSGVAEIPYPLYFSKERSKWGSGGVAFIDHQKSKDELSIGRKYLITAEQFAEVVAQENNRNDLTIDLDEVIENGFSTIGSGWYGRIVCLGELNGAPMFTFTNNLPMSEMKCNKPSAAYLSTIARGLLELGLDQEDVIDYFLNKQGISGIFTKKDLYDYIWS
ncbi:hypothetical protein SAMN05216389_11630 [Oceanobacillus limi]|uniref:Histone deacetylase n=1 Tax=Oceanobacillus limi TaxID=930131 RepID=A0A1I0FP20_9BACI|nr:hypothetical protein [Oceanobacillus limi]SET59323.1 hypothetical protein SAMN05216389_11630 [Oceanobacillus limi]